MANVNDNDILAQEEFSDYRARTARYRFMNQMFLGIGGATLFGVVSAIGVSLLRVVAEQGVWTAASAAPLLGLGAFAVLGVTCIYLGSKYLTKNIILDQDFQAKRIGTIARGKGVVIEPEQGHPPVLPAGMDGAARDQQDPEPDTAHGKWAEKMAASRPIVAGLSRADADKPWAERTMVAKEEAPQLAGVRT